MVQISSDFICLGDSRNQIHISSDTICFRDYGTSGEEELIWTVASFVSEIATSAGGIFRDVSCERDSYVHVNRCRKSQ